RSSGAGSGSTRVPCTWRGTTIGRGEPARASTPSQPPGPVQSRASRNPCRNPGIALHEECVSMAALARRRSLRYPPPRGGAGACSARRAGDARPAGPPHLRAAARLATHPRSSDAAPAQHRDPLIASTGLRGHPLEVHAAVAEDLGERMGLVVVLVED